MKTFVETYQSFCIAKGFQFFLEDCVNYQRSQAQNKIHHLFKWHKYLERTLKDKIYVTFSVFVMLKYSKMTINLQFWIVPEPDRDLDVVVAAFSDQLRTPEGHQL